MPRRLRAFRCRAVFFSFVVFLSLSAATARCEDSYFKGESCVRCHAQVRDRVPPPTLPLPTDTAVYGTRDERDVIVIGGGLSGLVAAHRLRAYNVLLLEKEDKVGGKVRSESWDRFRYPVAAGYLAQPYLDVMKELFADLDLRGDPVADPTNSIYTKTGEIVHDPFGQGLSKLPEPESVKRSLERMAREMKAFMENDRQISDVPPVPETRQLKPIHRKEDQTTFWDYMEGRYGRRAAEFADRYSLSVFGVKAREVSAYAGLVYFAADFGSEHNITWRGGPGILSERLAQSLGDRIELGAVVTAVSRGKNGVWVEYYKDDKRYLKHARAVVLAVPSLVSKRILLGLPEWKREALSRVRYSAYAVAMIAMDEIVLDSTFDLWSDLDTIFTDLGPNDWGYSKHTRGQAPGERSVPALGDSSPRGQGERRTAAPGAPAQILQAFVPLGESEGRGFLTEHSDEALGEKIVADLEKLFPGARSKVHGMRILRWGHAMPINFPGYLTRVRPQVAKPLDRVFFAGVDTDMPSIEGAIVSGARAADEVRKFLKSPRSPAASR